VGAAPLRGRYQDRLAHVANRTSRKVSDSANVQLFDYEIDPLRRAITLRNSRGLCGIAFSFERRPHAAIKNRWLILAQPNQAEHDPSFAGIQNGD